MGTRKRLILSARPRHVSRLGNWFRVHGKLPDVNVPWTRCLRQGRSAGGSGKAASSRFTRSDNPLTVGTLPLGYFDSEPLAGSNHPPVDRSTVDTVPAGLRPCHGRTGHQISKCIIKIGCCELILLRSVDTLRARKGIP